MTETSALQEFILGNRGKAGQFDYEAYHAALLHDWEHGREELIAELDSDGTGGIVRARGFEGYVGALRFDGTPMTDFRSIARSAHPTWRDVFAKDVDGRVWYVGKIKRNQHLEEMRAPLPNQAKIDAAAAEALSRLPGPVRVGTWKGD